MRVQGASIINPVKLAGAICQSERTNTLLFTGSKTYHIVMVLPIYSL